MLQTTRSKLRPRIGCCTPSNLNLGGIFLSPLPVPVQIHATGTLTLFSFTLRSMINSFSTCLVYQQLPIPCAVNLTQVNTSHPQMLQMDLKIITLNTGLTSFLTQTAKHSITIDKLSLPSLGFSQINILIPLKRWISAHLPHPPAELDLPVFLHTVPSHLLTFSSGLPSSHFSPRRYSENSFSLGNSSFSSALLPALLYIVVCCF